MKITSIQPQKLRADRVNVHVDGELRLALAAELAITERLHVGDEVDEARLAALEAQDGAWKARDAALSLLSHRARSKSELTAAAEAKGLRGGDRGRHRGAAGPPR